MSETTIARFNPKFIPSPGHENALKLLLIGENTSPACLSEDENPHATAVEWGWLVRTVPNIQNNFGALIDNGYVIETYWNSFNCTVMTMSLKADKWLSKRYGLPLYVEDEDDGHYRRKRSDWIRANISAKFRKPSGKQEKTRAKPTARTTSDFVSQISYTPAQAALAIGKIDALYLNGILRERSAAGYKATVTRRIAG